MSGEGRRLVIALGLPDRRLCGNGYLGKFARGRVVKQYREIAYRTADSLFGRVTHVAANEHYFPQRRPYFPADSRVRVDVTVRRDPLWAARRLDDDNLWRGLGPYLNGLQDAGLVANDRQFQLGAVTWETAQPYRGGLVLTLTEQGG